MDSKTVIHSVGRMPGPSAVEPLVRALLLIISNGGSFSTEEKWFHKAVTPLVNDGTLKREVARVSLGDDFEDRMMSLMEYDSSFIEVFRKYREWVMNLREQFDLTDTSVIAELEHFSTTDQRILYCAHKIAELSAENEALKEAFNNIASVVNQLSISQSVMETVVYREDSDS